MDGWMDNGWMDGERGDEGRNDHLHRMLRGKQKAHSKRYGEIELIDRDAIYRDAI